MCVKRNTVKLTPKAVSIVLVLQYKSLTITTSLSIASTVVRTTVILTVIELLRNQGCSSSTPQATEIFLNLVEVS